MDRGATGMGRPSTTRPRGEDTGEGDASTCDSEGTLRRTVFCGNIPVGTTRRALERFFRAAGCGAVASSRLRSCAPERLGVPKRAAILGGALHPARGSLNGYVVFREAASVACALQRNGAVFAGPDGRACHLRVDRCWMPPQRARAKKGHAVQGAVGVELDHRHSIFLGNVPYDASEEELRALFADCGCITNVRIVRDGRTGMGKGFAYVTFTPDSNVDLALARHAAVQVRGRALRVMRSSARLATKRQREEHPYVSENRRMMEEASGSERADVLPPEATMCSVGRRATGIPARRMRRRQTTIGRHAPLPISLRCASTADRNAPAARPRSVARSAARSAYGRRRRAPAKPPAASRALWLVDDRNIGAASRLALATSVLPSFFPPW
eukprot:ctg_1964.g467